MTTLVDENDEITLAVAAEELQVSIEDLIELLGIGSEELMSKIPQSVSKLYSENNDDEWIFNNARPARSYGEVAELLGVSRQTVWKSEKRALAKLRNAIEEDPEILSFANAMGIEERFMDNQSTLRKLKLIRLVSTAEIEDQLIPEAGKLRRIKPDEIRLFLMLLLAFCDESMLFTTDKKSFRELTQMAERKTLRLTAACERAGFIKVNKDGQKTVYQILTAKIERESRRFF